MKNLVKKIIRHELIGNASFLFFGSLLANLFNFLFNLFMTRHLSISDYGVLASMISLIALSTIPAFSVIPLIVRFAASYFANGELDKVRGLFIRVFTIWGVLGVGILFFFMFFAQQIGHFFHITNAMLIMLVGLAVLFGFLGVINTALLQAKLAFVFVSATLVLGGIIKFVAGAVFVFLGFAVDGATWGIFLSFFIPYVISFFPLRFLLDRSIKISHIGTHELLSYGIPSSVASFGIMSLITTDIILVKHFFDPVSAGLYAGISLIGRVIYYLTAPVGTVMFPLVTQKHTRKENYMGVFILSILIVVLPSLAITFFYFLFPTFSILFFTKKEYLFGASYIGFFGIFVSIYSLVSILVNFFLSIKKTKIFIPIIICALLQVVLISVWHDVIFHVIVSSFFVTGLLLIFLLIYYFKTNVHEAK